VVRNGVDGALFRVQDQALAKAALGVSGHPTVVCVSRLEREKGVLDLLTAFALVRREQPRARLLLVGGGAAAALVRERAAAPDLAGAVHLPGAVPLAEVPRYLAAADVVVMPSWAEGLPNTVLEALACGRRVVSTDVGGVSEVVDREELGRLTPPRQPQPMAQALLQVLAAGPLSPEQARRIAASASRTWEESASQLHQALRRASGERGGQGDVIL
jgi:glycosyltransferase involved in cell wall biosynthesis